MQRLEGPSIELFNMGFKSQRTKENYTYFLAKFLEANNQSPESFLELAKERPKEAELLILRFFDKRKKEVGGSVIKSTMFAIKNFLIMNDVQNGINWERVSKTLPRVRKVGQDRAPSVEEVRKILENCDLRMRTVVLIMLSSGMRIGGFDYLKWKDVEEVTAQGQRFAKLTVYRGEPEEYTTFITPEAYECLLDYKKRRELAGEEIAPQSWLVRNLWDISRPTGPGDIHKNPKKVRKANSKTLRNVLNRIYWKIGLRIQHKRRQEFEEAHGFRKFFETNANRVLKPIDIERLKGKLTNYNKPTDDVLRDEYVKAIPLLTVSEASELKSKVERDQAKNSEKLEQFEKLMLLQSQIIEGLKEKISDLEKKLEDNKKK